MGDHSTAEEPCCSGRSRLDGPAFASEWCDRPRGAWGGAGSAASEKVGSLTIDGEWRILTRQSVEVPTPVGLVPGIRVALVPGTPELPVDTTPADTTCEVTATVSDPYKYQYWTWAQATLEATSSCDTVHAALGVDLYKFIHDQDNYDWINESDCRSVNNYCKLTAYPGSPKDNGVVNSYECSSSVDEDWRSTMTFVEPPRDSVNCLIS